MTISLCGAITPVRISLCGAIKPVTISLCEAIFLPLYKPSNRRHQQVHEMIIRNEDCLDSISYGSSSPILSDRVRFPRFFRLAGPDQKINPSIIAMMKDFNWKKVATINEANEFFSVVIDDFVRSVENTEVTIISQEIFENDPMTRVENLKNRDARIIVTACYEDKARKLLCAAYKVGLYGPKIVWFFVRWFSKEFWRKNLDVEHVDCTAEQMDLVAEGSFVSGFFYRNPISERGIANMTADEFDQRFFNDDMYDSYWESFNFVAGPCYDHVWAAALALNCTDSTLKQNGHPKSLDAFTYMDTDIGDIIFNCMRQVSMIGVSGKLAFEDGADPSKNVAIERIQGGERKHVGLFRMDKKPRHFEWIEGALQWKDGNIPRDSTYLVRKEVLIPTSLYVPMSSLSGIGMLLAAGFFIFNVTFRRNKIVKMSSPNINSVLLLGCVMCYSTVFMKTTETDSSAICKARIFCFTLGFTVAFGAMFSKTWRVYRIFTNKKLLKRTIKDVQLLAIICGLVVVVLIVLISWEIVGPQTIIVKELRKEDYMLGNDAEVRPFVRMCQSEYSSYFGWAIIVIEGALLTFGAFLAWETRHVKIEAMNDSHQIGLCLYNVVILSAVGLTLSLLLDEQLVMMYGVTSGCIIIGTTVTQVVIFIPKIHTVRNKTENVVSTMPKTNGQTSSTGQQSTLPRQTGATNTTSVDNGLF